MHRDEKNLYFIYSTDLFYDTSAFSYLMKEMIFLSKPTIEPLIVLMPSMKIVG